MKLLLHFHDFDENNDMNVQSYLLGSIVCGALAMVPSPARAELCQLANMASYRLVGGNPIVVKQNIRPGEFITSYPQSGNGQIMAACSNRTVVDSRYIGLVPSGYPDVYKTSVEGLGIKLEWAPASGGSNVYPHNEALDQPGRYNIVNSGLLTYSFYRIDGDFTGGAIGAGGIVDVAETFADATRISRVRLDNVRFTLATCAITAGSLNQRVDLRTVSSRSFGSDGGSPWKTFDLESDNCDTSQFANATFSFTGTTVPGVPELFQVSGGGGGVGVQLGQPGGAEIVPGDDVVLPTQTAGGKYAFQARYKRIAGPLVGGEATASVVVHVDYD